MKSRLFTVYDSVAEDYGPIFEAKNEVVAVRSFKQMLQNPNNPVVIEDFLLYYLGEYDHDTAVIELASKPTIVVTGADVKRSIEKKE